MHNHLQTQKYKNITIKQNKGTPSAPYSNFAASHPIALNLQKSRISAPELSTAQLNMKTHA